MRRFNPKEILDFFEILNNNDINYILLRNINNELPDNLYSNKDIDIIVHPNDKNKLEQILIHNNWNDIKRHIKYDDDIYEFNFFNKNGLHIDVIYQLCHHDSIDYNKWVKMDDIIQTDIWSQRVKNEYWYSLSPEIYILHLVTRSIYDKKKFTNAYINEIIKTLPMCNIETLRYYFNIAFSDDSIITNILNHNFEI